MVIVAALGLFAVLASASPAAALVPGINWPVQSLGDRGNDVLAIQRLVRVRLVAMGVATLPPADGLFQASTVSAVKSWQSRRGLTVTGIVEGASWAALVMPLEAGARGEAVLALQVQLREKHRATMAVDGTFGSTTTAAVVSFQKHIGLTANGVVDMATWRALAGHFELPRFLSTQLCDYSVGNGAANWGMAEAIATLEAVGRSMVVLGYGRVAVGDISLEHPGNIPGHETHERGLDVDVRPLRNANDQCTWKTRWSYSSYDRAATRAMIKKFRSLAVGHIKVIYFNDPVLIREGLTTWYSGHDDHIHVRFCEKIHPIAMYDC
jgi:peptidoglycan hydrolase-like protein with peptidoglycan-binding domain